MVATADESASRRVRWIESPVECPDKGLDIPLERRPGSIVAAIPHAIDDRSGMLSKYFDTSSIDAFADAMVVELRRLLPPDAQFKGYVAVVV